MPFAPPDAIRDTLDVGRPTRWAEQSQGMDGLRGWPRTAARKKTFRILLAQGVCESTGLELNSERLVLPFFYKALGL